MWGHLRVLYDKFGVIEGFILDALFFTFQWLKLYILCYFVLLLQGQLHNFISEEKSKLSKEGQDLKKIITSGQRKREAHVANFDPAVIKKPNLDKWAGSGFHVLVIFIVWIETTFLLHLTT